MTSHLFAASSAFTILLASTAAQSFSYPDFGNVSTLSLLGNAVQSGTALRLTANAINQTGWAWHQTAMPILAGFDTTFTFRITPPAVGKAEGMAFVIHDDPNGTNTQGGTVWGMGYGNGANSSPGIRNSIALEFDTYMDAFLGDTSANELTIHTRGSNGNNEQEQWSIGRTTPATNLANGQVHSLRIHYVPGTLSVYVDAATTPAITTAYDFTTGGQYLSNSPAPGANLQSGLAWLGFCATTGANSSLTELVEILSWSWTSTPLVDPCYAGSFGEDGLTIDGSVGGPLRKVTVATHQPFTIGMAAPTTHQGPAPYILLMTPLPQPGVFGTALGFGNACMPMLPLGPLVFVAADSFGWLGGGLPAGPAPTAIAIPTGLVSFPIDLTLQAVIETTSSPFTIGLTNAIDLRVEVSPAPTISSVSPLSAAPATPITIAGGNFVPGLTLTLNGNPTAITSQTATLLTFPYPAALPCVSQVIVRNPDGRQATALINPVPLVTGTVFGTGPAAGNATFMVFGIGFAPGMTATIGGSPASVVSATPFLVTMLTPPGTPGQATVVLTTPGSCSVSTTYTYQ